MPSLPWLCTRGSRCTLRCRRLVLLLLSFVTAITLSSMLSHVTLSSLTSHTEHQTDTRPVMPAGHFACRSFRLGLPRQALRHLLPLVLLTCVNVCACACGREQVAVPPKETLEQKQEKIRSRGMRMKIDAVVELARISQQVRERDTHTHIYIYTYTHTHTHTHTYI